ncbi:MAG: septum formation initiator family protein [Acidimicrobiales bacterium]
MTTTTRRKTKSGTTRPTRRGSSRRASKRTGAKGPADTIVLPAFLHPRRLAWTALVLTTAVVAVMFILIPATSWLELRSDVDSRQTEFDRLEVETARLEQRVVDLQTDREIERLARSEYNLVYPNEEAYAVLPPPPKNTSSSDIRE